MSFSRHYILQDYVVDSSFLFGSLVFIFSIRICDINILMIIPYLEKLSDSTSFL